MARQHHRTGGSNRRSNWSTLFGVSLQMLLSLPLGGCTCVGPFFRTFTVRGKVLSADTGEPRAGVFISVRLLREGEVVGYASGTESVTESRSVGSKTPVAIVTNADGSFAIVMRNRERAGCLAGLVDTPTAEDPAIPDQVRVTIAVDGCQQVFIVDLIEETVLDISFSDDVIELKDPILVPPCEE